MKNAWKIKGFQRDETHRKYTQNHSGDQDRGKLEISLWYCHTWVRIPPVPPTKKPLLFTSLVYNLYWQKAKKEEAPKHFLLPTCGIVLVDETKHETGWQG